MMMWPVSFVVVGLQWWAKHLFGRQSDSLAVHWVAKEGSIKVIEVVEEDKESNAAIGSKF
jgi:hypothetical protein